jgi:hypothetical protein
LNLVGRVFCRLTVLERSLRFSNGVPYWKCLCECGTHCEVWQGSLTRKKGIPQKSCGCLNKENCSWINRLEGNLAAKKDILRIYKKRAVTKGVQFLLSEEEFFSLLRLPCHYCRIEPSTVSRGAEPFIFNGLDRKNWKLGYVIDNVVPCCRDCNMAKNTIPYDKFLLYLKRIVSSCQ